MTNQTPEQRFLSYRQIVPNFEAFCRKLSCPLPVHLRINTLKASIAETCLRLEQCGVLFVPEKPFSIVLRVQNIPQPGHLPAFSLGHLHSQALSSVLAGLALEPEAGDLVLDLCAAPGSKTSLLAQLMDNKGIIIANDKSAYRLVPLTANLKRLGVVNTITAHYPGQQFPKEFSFNRVLVDVPCSAEGTLRASALRTPRQSGQHGRRLQALQRMLLLRAFDLLKPGGTLVYSTCTYNPDENEGVVQYLLEHRPARIQPITLDIAHSPGLERWQEMTYDPSIHQCWRIYPHQLDTVGFFLARVGREA